MRRNTGNSKFIGGMRYRANSTILWYSSDSSPKYTCKDLMIITKFDKEEIKLGQFVLETSPGMADHKHFLIRGDRNEDVYHWHPINRDEILAWGYMPDPSSIREKIYKELEEK